jgi:YbbR domain-containing protein
MAWHPFRNIGLKIAALALGTVLWYTVSGHQIERRVPVPIAYRNVPATLEITGDELAEVMVHVRGGDNLVRSIGREALSVVVDLADAHAGANFIQLRTDQVVGPLGVEVMQIDPGSITVTLEASGREEIRVTPVIEGQPAAGYVETGVTVQPQTVTVIGPLSRLKELGSATTERVVIDGATASVVQTVNVGVGDADLRLGDLRTVSVTVRIEAASTERLASGRPVVFRGQPQSGTLDMQAPSIDVVVQCTAEVGRDLDVASIAPYIDLAGRVPGQYNLPVRVDLPLGCSLKETRPSTISVRIR